MSLSGRSRRQHKWPTLLSAVLLDDVYFEISTCSAARFTVCVAAGFI